MSRFLLLNFEDFGLNQDITKTIHPFNPFCICCLDREGPMFDLEKCEHSDYLNAFDLFDKPQLKQFNQLVCLQCHNILKKIKCFQNQVIESFNILLSGTFTDATINNKRLNSLIIQKVVDNLHLPPDIISEDSIVEGDIPNNSLEDNFIDVIQNSSLEENFDPELTNVLNKEENLMQEQNRLNKNIKTALEILERNNQSFVTLGSQLQFLNGEHLSFLESSLLSKEILTDIPLVPAKNLSADLDSGLLNSSKSLEIEIDGPDKMFYDSLDLSPELMGKESNTSELIEIAMETPHAAIMHNETKPDTAVIKPKKERKAQKNISPVQIRRVKLNQDELNRERVLQAQSDAYLRFKFRCETCIVGFNYKENLEDHIKRKHGPKEGDNVICGICSQLIPNAGSVTGHNYRHYTRYECGRCNKRFQTYDEAIRHYARSACATGDTANASLKMKQTAQLSKTKLKIKQAQS